MPNKNTHYLVQNIKGTGKASRLVKGWMGSVFGYTRRNPYKHLCNCDSVCVGSGDYKPRCWMSHWEENTGGPQTDTCVNENCSSDNPGDLVGAHVMIKDERMAAPRTWYILPLCKDCNNDRDNARPMWVSKDWEPVPVSPDNISDSSDSDGSDDSD